jgi:hypothetical protein
MKKYLISFTFSIIAAVGINAQPLSKINFSLANKLNSEQPITRLVSLKRMADVLNTVLKTSPPLKFHWER